MKHAEFKVGVHLTLQPNGTGSTPTRLLSRMVNSNADAFTYTRPSVGVTGRRTQPGNISLTNRQASHLYRVDFPPLRLFFNLWPAEIFNVALDL